MFPRLFDSGPLLVKPEAIECFIVNNRLSFYSLYPASDELVSLVSEIKNRDKTYFLRQLAATAAVLVSDIPGFRFDLISYIPSSPDRAKKRGYEHTGLFAQFFASELGSTHCELLKSVEKRRSQVGLTPRERAENVKGAFCSTTRCFGDVLLLDDLVTTGTTALEASRTLLAAGARSVSCFCLAINPQFYKDLK